MAQIILVELGNSISTCFNKEELRSLCFDLGINFENVPGETQEVISRELVLYCQRLGKLPELIHKCKELRPNTDWSKYATLEVSDQSIKSSNQQSPIVQSALVVGLALFFLLAAVFIIMKVIGPDRMDGSGETTPSTTGASVASGEGTNTSPLALTIKITRPEEAAEVNREVIVQGELTGEMCQECQMYVVVHPLHAQPNYYYWQKDAQPDLSEDSFAVTGVIVGSQTTSDNNKQYEIWVMLSSNAPPKPNMTTDEWLGFHKEVLDHVTVTRVGL